MILDENTGSVYTVDRLVTTGTFAALYKKAYKKSMSRQYINTMCHAGRLDNIIIDGIHFIILGPNKEVPRLLKKRERKEAEFKAKQEAAKKTPQPKPEDTQSDEPDFMNDDDFNFEFID